MPCRVFRKTIWYVWYMKHKLMKVGYVPWENRSCVHQQDWVQDARGISSALVAGTHGCAMHFTKTMIIYETD